MTIITNSSFKVKAGNVVTSVGIPPEAGALLFDQTLGYHVLGNGTAWVRVNIIPYSDTFWIDMLGPLVGKNLDTSSGRIDYNYFNGGVGFQANARYPNEVIIQHIQINHWWKLITDGRPHLHWPQQSTNIPNWVFAWRLSRNGEPGSIETDFSNFNHSKISSHEFTYTSGVLNQISDFPDIDLSLANISDLLTVAFFRDTTNATGLFAGVDPSVLVEIASDLDIHIEVDTPGSRQEYIK